MVEGQVLGWGLAPRLQGMLQVLRRKAWEQEARLALSVGLLQWQAQLRGTEQQPVSYTHLRAHET